jgi:hypothetical protein
MGLAVVHDEVDPCRGRMGLAHGPQELDEQVAVSPVSDHPALLAEIALLNIIRLAGTCKSGDLDDRRDISGLLIHISWLS